MYRFLVVLLLCGAAQAQDSAQRLRARHARVVAQMLVNIRAQRLGRKPQNIEKRQVLAKRREALRERQRRAQEESDRRFREMIARQPKPKYDQYKTYRIKKENGLLPLCDYQRWKQSAGYRPPRRPVRKKVEEKKATAAELDRGLTRALGDALSGITPKRREQEEEPDEDEEEEE